ncbi:MAG TPA: hypothetical protein O0X63_00915 [Methanocorpusculum sp.]|nr:hypothetical protein [Methanocorpusculum sp.]
MKKLSIIVICLVLVLLGAGVVSAASAAAETTVTYDMKSSYSLQISPSVIITPEGVDLDVTATSIHLEPTENLSVTIESANYNTVATNLWAMIHSTEGSAHYIAYHIHKESPGGSNNHNQETAVRSGDPILDVAMSELLADTPHTFKRSVNLALSLENPSARPDIGGDFVDTLSFYVEVYTP